MGASSLAHTTAKSFPFQSNGGRMVVKVRDEDTAGAYSIHDNTIPPGSPGPRPHIHRHHEEAFYVLEGELTVRVGPQKLYKLLLAPRYSCCVRLQALAS